MRRRMTSRPMALDRKWTMGGTESGQEVDFRWQEMDLDGETLTYEEEHGDTSHMKGEGRKRLS